MMQISSQSCDKVSRKWEQWQLGSLMNDHMEVGEKLNVDGCCLGKPVQSGGGVVRNERAQLLTAFTHHYGEGTNTWVEVKELWDGLKLWAQRNLLDIEVESDSKVLINWLLGHGSCPWFLHDIWEQIVELKVSFSISFRHVYWELNQVADGLAKLGAQGMVWIFDSHNDLACEVRGALALDRAGIPYLHCKYSGFV